jgi:hypothetical protein
MSESTTAVSTETSEVTALGNGELVETKGRLSYPVYTPTGNFAAAFDISNSEYLPRVAKVLSAWNAKAEDYMFSTALMILATEPADVTPSADMVDRVIDHVSCNVVGAKDGLEYATIVKYGNANAKNGRRCLIVSCERRQVAVKVKKDGKEITEYEFEYFATNANGFRPRVKK